VEYSTEGFMIKIFGSSPSSNPKPKIREKRAKADPKKQDKLGQEKLDKLDPMVIPLLAVGLKNSPSNSFLTSSQDVICNNPYRLSDNWINSLNKWAQSQTKAMVLDPPTALIVGARNLIGPVIVEKIVEPKMNVEFPMPALICIDKNGWKYYFKTSKAHDFDKGDSISFSGQLTSHGEGISFFKRPTKIQKVIFIEPVG